MYASGDDEGASALPQKSTWHIIIWTQIFSEQDFNTPCWILEIN